MTDGGAKALSQGQYYFDSGTWGAERISWEPCWARHDASVIGYVGPKCGERTTQRNGIALYSLSFFPRLPFGSGCGLFLVKSRYSWQNVPLKLAPKSKKRLGTPEGRSVLQVLVLSELSNRFQRGQNPMTLLDSFGSCDLEKLGTTHFASGFWNSESPVA
jgi:hypothetical protein